MFLILLSNFISYIDERVSLRNYNDKYFALKIGSGNISKQKYRAFVINFVRRFDNTSDIRLGEER